MTDNEIEGSLHKLEGMIAAHRKLLAQIVLSLPQSAALTAALEDRGVMRDGQEDPGAVPTDGLALELAIAEEMNRIRNIVEVQRFAQTEE
ncbi:hypothetical protein [Falsirhodobacter xinxiangensis]|uniref:hypothetical protein n=1 Tax=Falsirhodobacter xinxiangensis TaxID=2530049 RepID=UPI0010AA91FE|nr:hypothetical protein [Rhodobacter xinxiangensis]